MPSSPRRRNVMGPWQVADCDVQADKLQILIKAAKIEDVEPIWTSIFAKVRLERKGLRETESKR